MGCGGRRKLKAAESNTDTPDTNINLILVISVVQ